jgi:hypothetical protein
MVKVYVFILTKNGLGFVWAIVSSNSSGHSAKLDPNIYFLPLREAPSDLLALS